MLLGHFITPAALHASCFSSRPGIKSVLVQFVAIVAMVLTMTSIACAADDAAIKNNPNKSATNSPESMTFEGAQFRKGMPREPVISKLTSLYTLQKLRGDQGEEDSWLISEKANADNYLGMVSFKTGKLSRFARFRKWTDGDDAVELAGHLCDLLEQLTREQGTLASIVTRTTDSGNISVRGVEMVFRDKRVSLNIITRGDLNSKKMEVHLDEVLQ